MSRPDSYYDDVSEEFDFEQGDTVFVRVRRDGGTSGPLRAKFVADVVGFNTPNAGEELRSDRVVLSPPWSSSARSGLSFRSYDAEYTIVDDMDEVRF